MMITKQNKKNSQHPKFFYEKEDDILNIWLAEGKIDFAEQNGDVIVHFSKKNEPIYIEILDASNFLKREAEDLPHEIKQKFFATP